MDVKNQPDQNLKEENINEETKARIEFNKDPERVIFSKNLLESPFKLDEDEDEDSLVNSILKKYEI